MIGEIEQVLYDEFQLTDADVGKYTLREVAERITELVGAKHYEVLTENRSLRSVVQRSMPLITAQFVTVTSRWAGTKAAEGQIYKDVVKLHEDATKLVEGS